MLELKADARIAGKKNDAWRKNGKMPAVFYGNNVSSTPIAIDVVEFERVLREAGESSVIELKTPDGSKEVIIQDVDIDPIKNAPRHADFYVIDKNKKITVTVPLVFEGVAPAEKELNGTLVKVMHEIEIEVLPKDSPHDLKIDISALKDFESRITVGDIVLPESAEATADSDETVALVEAQRSDVSEETGPADISEIEVEKKGKKEGDDGSSTPQSEDKKEE